MKKLVKTLSLVALLIVSGFALMACSPGAVDPTKLAGTWTNADAEITQIQFIERSNENGVLEGDVSFYVNGEKEPRSTDFWQSGTVYNIDMSDYEGGLVTYRVELKDGKLILTSNSGVSWEYTKKYEN